VVCLVVHSYLQSAVMALVPYEMASLHSAGCLAGLLGLPIGLLLKYGDEDQPTTSSNPEYSHSGFDGVVCWLAFVAIFHGSSDISVTIIKTHFVTHDVNIQQRFGVALKSAKRRMCTECPCPCAYNITPQ